MSITVPVPYFLQTQHIWQTIVYIFFSGKYIFTTTFWAIKVIIINTKENIVATDVAHSMKM